MSSNIQSNLYHGLISGIRRFLIEDRSDGDYTFDNFCELNQESINLMCDIDENLGVAYIRHLQDEYNHWWEERRNEKTVRIC